MWRNDTKCKCMLMFPLKNLARKGTRSVVIHRETMSAILENVHWIHAQIPEISNCQTVEKGTRTLQWRHSGCDSVSNHQPRDCFFNLCFRRRSKKTSKIRVTGRCAGNSPGTGEFPAQMASNAENISIWWRLMVSQVPNVDTSPSIPARYVCGDAGITCIHTLCKENRRPRIRLSWLLLTNFAMIASC